MSMTALPLIRLDSSSAALGEWMTQHERSIRDNSGAPVLSQPRRFTSPVWGKQVSIPRLGPGAVYRDEDAATFESRLSEYLNVKRFVLPYELEDGVVRSNGNKVFFVVTNASDDAIAGVQLTVGFPRNEIAVRSVPPRIPLMPEVPRWPNAPDPPASAGHRETTPSTGEQIVEMISEEWIEATFDIGDLRPRERTRTPTLTVAPTTNAPETIQIKLTARAMDRRGTATTVATLTVSKEVWSPKAFLYAGVEDR